MEIIAYHILVTGKVQGVLYRKSTFKKANELGIAGWVKNLPDGSVEIEAEGPEFEVNELLKWCQKGPKNAVVEQLTHKRIAIQGFKGFGIARD